MLTLGKPLVYYLSNNLTKVREMKINCACCGSDYTPSMTSSKEYCYPCTIRPKADIRVFSAFKPEARGIHQIELKTRITTDVNPESWGKLPSPDQQAYGVCLCTACGEIFKSVSGFDKHREDDGNDRRCITPQEMRKKGMSINASGRWITQEYTNFMVAS